MKKIPNSKAILILVSVRHVATASPQSVEHYVLNNIHFRVDLHVWWKHSN